MFSSKAFVVAVFCVITTIATPFMSCHDGPTPLELRVEGCDAKLCTFHRGQDVNSEWDFVVVEDTHDLRPRVKVTALGSTFDHDLPEENVCDSLINGNCPLIAGEKVTYGLSVPILKSYPSVSALLEFALLGDNDNVHVCFKLNVKIAKM